ncbi:hypothetical protein B0H16DRAFT_1500330 [Mycena metata]|uniref:Uncharacterized protein n=1 Tax=Mycena metata TaxID=1033252 RepID=A0AAD7K7S9_9AGAR|nr:hypothetical protein B0H16DRAFT_1500330 [Mycena metata]
MCTDTCSLEKPQDTEPPSKREDDAVEIPAPSPPAVGTAEGSGESSAARIVIGSATLIPQEWRHIATTISTMSSSRTSRPPARGNRQVARGGDARRYSWPRCTAAFHFSPAPLCRYSEPGTKLTALERGWGCGSRWYGPRRPSGRGGPVAWSAEARYPPCALSRLHLFSFISCPIFQPQAQTTSSPQNRPATPPPRGPAVDDWGASANGRTGNERIARARI